MAVRLYAEFRSDRGDQYKIEIHDSQWLAAATEFNVDSRGFELTYEGETDDIVSPIIGSRLSFGAYSANATFETFIETLKTFQENRFRVVVRRISSQDIATDFETRVVTDGGTLESLSCVTDAVNALGLDSYELFWAGWITQDLVNVEDASQPYIYEITATDGIGRLANIDYTSANTINQTGLKITRLTDVVVDVLNQIGTDDLWGGSEPYLETSVDWWETNSQTYSTAVDPFYNHAFDVRLFHSRDDDGNVVYASAFDVLRQLTTLYNARIYIQRGRFVFEQYGNRDTTSRYVSRYDKTGTSIGRLLISDDVSVDQTIVAARRAGNNWDFLPALKNVSVQYVQRFLNPLNAFGVFKFTETATSYTAGFIAGGVGTQLSFGTFAFTMLVTGPVDPYPVFAVFKIRIRIQDASTGTYYYCNRDFNGFLAANMYDPTIWTTTPGYYYFDLPAFYPLTQSSLTTPINIVTPDIPVSGELDFELTLHDILDSSNGTQYAYSGIVEHNGVFAFGIQTNGNIVGATTFSSVNNQAGIDSALTLELGEINIADGPTQTGHLSVYNGTSWVGTEDWRKGSTGSTLPILKLLTNETLALHVRPIEQYNGNVISASLFGQRLLFNSTAYLFTSATFTANTDEWNGTLFKIQRLRTAVSELDAVPVLAERTPLIGGTSTLGSSPNDVVAGRVAGMIVIADEKKLGPYEQTSTGGRINGTANITGVATMEKTTIVGLETFVDTFAARVAADGGTIESATCVSDAITTLSDGALVSLIPTDIAAPLTTAEAVTMKKTLDVAAAVTMASTLDVGDALDVAGNAVFESNVQVDGDTTIVGTIDVTDLEVSNDLSVDGASTLGSLSAGTTTLGASTISSASVTGNTSVGGTLGVTGTATLGTLNAAATSVSTLNASGAATIGGTLGVTGTATLGTLNAAATSVTTLAASGNATLGGTLGVTGATTLGTLDAGASTLASSNVTGNASVSGTLGVTGASTLGTLNAGASTLGTLNAAATSVTTLNASGNTTLGGTLGVTGASTLGTLNAGASTLASSAVTGNQTIGGTLGVTGASTLGTLNAGASTIGSATITGNTSVGGTLGVTGTATLGTLNAAATSVSTLNASGNATLGGTLGVTGATTLGTLNAGASTLSSSNVTGNASVGGTLGVTGTSTLGTLNAGTTTLGASTLASSNVTGNQTIGGTLGVTGASTLGTLNAGTSTLGAATLASSNVTGNQTIGGTLGVTGASTLGTLNAGASTLASSSVTGNASVGGTLGVTGASTLGTLNAGTTTLGASTIGSATITGNASVGGTTTLADVTANDAVLDNFVTKTAVIGTTGLVESFRARVLADGGTFEAFDEVVTAVTELLAGGSNKSAVVYGETQVQTLAAEATSVTTLAASGAATMGSTLGVTGAATLSSTLAVTGAATLSSTLGVTGTSNLSNTNIDGAANFNTTASVNGAWYAAVDDVEASASGTYEVKNTDYILFVTWSGGSGTFTIALPPIESSEGRMIRIKTDSTISNSNALSITPDEGDTGVLIDGESSSSMTRSYDGATYLAHNGEWWVIQKKDKG